MLEREELLGATVAEHLQLQAQLTLLGQEEVREHRVGDLLHGDLGKPLEGHLGVVLELAVAELGHPPVLLELAANLGEVDGRQVEEEPEATGEVGQLAVDREVARRRGGWRSCGSARQLAEQEGHRGFERGGELVEVVDGQVCRSTRP